MSAHPLTLPNATKSRSRLRDPLVLAERVVARRRAERARRYGQRQREERARLRKETIGSIDHELRTPLTSVVGYTELVLGGEAGELNELQEQMLLRVSANAAVLLGLVEEMLGITCDWVSEGREVDVVELAQHVIAERTRAAESAPAFS